MMVITVDGDNDTLNYGNDNGSLPTPWYHCSVPFWAQQIAVRTELFATAAKVEVNGLQSDGVSRAIDLLVEPAINVVSIRVFSAYSDAVSITYHLQVLRAARWASSTTTSSTSPFSVVRGEISLDVSDCLLLSDADAATR
eukprot:Skav201883  [mRNA]  locus=scaffold550:268841:273668:- [translate_table: standard]